MPSISQLGLSPDNRDFTDSQTFWGEPKVFREMLACLSPRVGIVRDRANDVTGRFIVLSPGNDGWLSHSIFYLMLTATRKCNQRTWSQCQNKQWIVYREQSPAINMIQGKMLALVFFFALQMKPVARAEFDHVCLHPDHVTKQTYGK